MRREYSIPALDINELIYFKLVIDPHVDKHSDHIDDNLIKQLVRYLANLEQRPIKTEGRYQYFLSLLRHEGRVYKMIWLLDSNESSIGVISVFRDRRHL